RRQTHLALCVPRPPIPVGTFHPTETHLARSNPQHAAPIALRSRRASRVSLCPSLHPHAPLTLPELRLSRGRIHSLQRVRYPLTPPPKPHNSSGHLTQRSSCRAGRRALGRPSARAVRRFAAAHSSPHAYHDRAGGASSPGPQLSSTVRPLDAS